MDATPTSTGVAGLASSSDGAPLAADDIERALTAAWPGGCAVEAVVTTGSTHDDLVARARAEQPPRCVLRAADFQTGGRGRHQRAWRAARGDALLFSIAIPIAAVPAALSAVTLACGVALAECFAEHGVAVRLKWPNDVRVNGHKLAGVLSELVTDRAARYTLVTGVGLNMRLDDAARDAIGQPAIALDPLLSASADRGRERWIGRLGGAMLAATAQFVCDGFAPFCTRFNRLLEARGQMVDVVDGSRTLSGRVIEVDRSGYLVIDAGGARHHISVGDVSVRT